MTYTKSIFQKVVLKKEKILMNTLRISEKNISKNYLILYFYVNYSSSDSNKSLDTLVSNPSDAYLINT